MKSEVMKTSKTEVEYRRPMAKVIEVEFQRAILGASDPVKPGENEGGEEEEGI